MSTDDFPNVSLYNVATLAEAEWTNGGHQVRRVPDSIAERLNEHARERVGYPSGCELRFVPDGDDETVSVTLSAAAKTTVWPFWGDFQSDEAFEIDSTPRTIDIDVPDRVGSLKTDAVGSTPFDPLVCRLRFARLEPVAVHDVVGNCRPPTDAELPDRRYVAYGTSITEGLYATAPHLSYVSHAARAMDADVLNLGTGGSAYCDPAMAEHIAGIDDADVVTLALSVNMANAHFTVEQFRDRARAFVDTVAGSHPDTPVACITLFPYHADCVRGDDRQRADGFRTALAGVVESTGHEDVVLIDGPSVMDVTGLTTDMLHPGDAGMASIGAGIAAALTDGDVRR